MAVNSLVKRMAITELRENMVLAHSIKDQAGAVLLPKNTLLNERHFALLVNNHIVSVYIVEESINWMKPRFEYKCTKDRQWKVEKQPIKETIAFKQTEKAYTRNTAELKEQLLAISHGEEVAVDELLKITHGIMDTLHYKGELFSYLQFLKSTDEHTFTHSINVGLLSNIFGQWLGLHKGQLETLTISGLLHDVGKTRIPSSILNKVDALSDLEFDIIKQHSLEGYRLLKPLETIPNEAKVSALLHHEKIDGTGYPLSLTDGAINPYAKIVTICDIYDAMTSNRVYRQKLSPFHVMKQFERQRFGELDTRYLLIFLQNIAYNYLGSLVTLSNGDMGEVVFINRRSLAQPIVRVHGDLIDLMAYPTIEIEAVIS